MLGDELDREVPVARLDGVVERVRAHLARGVPAGGTGVAAGAAHAASSRVARVRSSFGEQPVVAVPLATRVDADDEPVGALEVGQHVVARTLPVQGIRELRGDAVDERRAQEERAQLGQVGGRGPRRADSHRPRGRRRRTPSRSAPGRRGPGGSSAASRRPAAHPSVRAQSAVTRADESDRPCASSNAAASLSVNASSAARISVRRPRTRRTCNGSAGSARAPSTSRSCSGACRTRKRRSFEALARAHDVDVVEHEDHRLARAPPAR